MQCETVINCLINQLILNWEREQLELEDIAALCCGRMNDEWVKKCVDSEAEGVHLMLEIVLKQLAMRALHTGHPAGLTVSDIVSSRLS